MIIFKRFSRQEIKKTMPVWLLNLLRSIKSGLHLNDIPLFYRYYYDFKRYNRYNGAAGALTKTSAEAFLIKTYHIIEKGMALPSPRVGYGKKVVSRLVIELNNYIDNFGADKVAITSYQVLNSYFDFNMDNGYHDVELEEDLGLLSSKLQVQKTDNCGWGGTITLNRDSVFDSAVAPFPEFVRSRYSIRNFDDKLVSRDIIKKAVEISLKTPSVCNRQPWRVRCYEGQSICQKILAYQNGNKGFGHSINNLLIVTCNISAFFGNKECNEPLIDGGMFSMSLVYALHYLCVGTCCLNLCLNPDKERSFRKIIKIPEQEALVLMIAVGNLRDSFKVAKSSRKRVEDILSFKGPM